MVSPGNLAWRLSNNARYTAANMLLQYLKRSHTLPWKVGLKELRIQHPGKPGPFFCPKGSELFMIAGCFAGFVVHAIVFVCIFFCNQHGFKRVRCL